MNSLSSRILVLTSMLMVVGAGPAAAVTVTCLNCATVVTQLLEKAQVTITAVESVQQTIEQIKMVEHMVTNLKKFGVTPLSMRHTQATIRNLVRSLKSNAATGMNVANAMNGLQGEYGDQYRDFAFYQQAQQNQWQGNTPDRNEWDSRYEDWSEETHKKVLTPLETARDLDENMGDSEDQRLAQLQGQLAGAEGESKLLEVLAGLAALQIEQMQKLRGLLVLDMESDAVYRAALMERITAREADMSTVRREPANVDPAFNQGMNWKAAVR